MTFGASAARLAGLAGALLHWRPDTFWAATPQELGCVLRALAGDAGGEAGHAMPPPDAARLTALKQRFPD